MPLAPLLANNKVWAKDSTERDPQFFERLATQQSPKYLWIGCADSRVPANQITGLDPGEVFVHRNIANVVVHTDLNCLSVVQYAVEVLKVTDIIICGHYGCGGVQAALGNKSLGLIDSWLRHIKDAAARHLDELNALPPEERFDRMCELNVKQQVTNLCCSAIVQRAWAAKQDLTVHGVVYSLRNGLLQDLNLNFNSPDQLPDIYTYR